MTAIHRTDIAVIGGGYYGCFAALEAKRLRGNAEVTLLEQAPELFARASSTNQGELQRGYLYSGDPELAQDCATAVGQFEQRFKAAINPDDELYYAVHRDSTISAAAFRQFCVTVGLATETTEHPPVNFFGEPIDIVFKVDEKMFDNQKLQGLFRKELRQAGVHVVPNFDAQRIVDGPRDLTIFDRDRLVAAKHVFNATFADINRLHMSSQLPDLPLQHDVFLHFQIALPEALRHLGAVVMRGPFASIMPESSSGRHVLASGKFRNLRSARDDAPSERVSEDEVQSRYREAIADAVGYLPVLALAQLQGSVVGTRTAFLDAKTGKYSSKAMVFPNYGGLSGYHVVLGGKVGCLTDISGPLSDILRGNAVY